MNWSILFSVIIILIVLLIILCILKNRTEPKDKRCCTCRKKDREEFMEIRCRNRKSKHYKSMVDDYQSCKYWRG